MTEREAPPGYRPLLRRDLDRIPQLRVLKEEERFALKVVSTVFPFRANSYVVDHLIDWSRVPEDPLYVLTFPQRKMLAAADFDRVAGKILSGASAAEIQREARRIQHALNPHPAGQMDLNVPELDGVPLEGMQHKYRETVLFFPTQGQTCHAYCTYCFRWAQFVGIEEYHLASRRVDLLTAYLRNHREVTDVLITGGDPLVMKTEKLRFYIEALLAEDLEHVINIRIGTKALANWPYRFTTDPDADELLALFEQVRRRRRQVAIMAHCSHPRELDTPEVREAVRRLRSAGCNIRSQAPLVRHVNDDAGLWAEMWNRQLRMGIIPYYMFVERNTGPKNFFEVPLARALEIYQGGIRRVGGLGRTVRGPSMSASPGKVCIEGTGEVGGEKVFVLSLLQGRDPEWANRPFFAGFDRKATWFSHLRPALGRDRFFFE
jgi:KamA family protein